jgi:hypothetical protein
MLHQKVLTQQAFQLKLRLTIQFGRGKVHGRQVHVYRSRSLRRVDEWKRGKSMPQELKPAAFLGHADTMSAQERSRHTQTWGELRSREDRSKILDPQSLIRIAESYLEASDSRRDPMVIAAYRQLEAQTDVLFRALTQTIRIAFTHCSAPYSSDNEMIGAARTERLLEIPTAESDADHDHPFFGCDYGGAYDRFRAVHDYLGHVRLNTGFERQGEYLAWLEQDRYHGGLARWALATELHGKNSVLCATGETAVPKATLLDRGLLRRSKIGLLHDGVLSESLSKCDRGIP